jgi:Mg/Co/Ni transporter MgtE
VPRNQEEYCQNSARESNDEYHLLNVEPTSPELLTSTIHEFSTKSSHNAAISATATILATFSAVLPSVAGNSVNSAATANPRNIATTTWKFIKTIQDLRTQKPCHLSEQSCPSQEDQLWNLKPKRRETTISDL